MALSATARTDPRRPLRLLLVEDSATDAELLTYALTTSYELTTRRVCTATDMREALRSEPWDVVVSDYNLPNFSAPDALAMLHEFGLDLPFIIVSGTIGEETAVTSLKAGACDFLVKGRLARLVPAIERELREATVRRERAKQALEDRLRQAQKVEAIGQLAGGVAHDLNNMLTAILGYAELLTEQIGPDELIGKDLKQIVMAAERASALTRQLLAFGRKQNIKPLGREAILLVEDEPSIRSFAKSVLERHGYRVLEAESSEEAIARLSVHDGRVDMLLTDVMLSGIDGGQLAVRLKRTRPDLRVLFMSGYADPDIGRTLPCSDLLEKPFTAHTLLSRVRDALARKNTK